jgi:signal recognition particle subunit SEC65
MVVEAGAIYNPHLNTLRDLARALGIDPRELVPDE